MELFTNVILRSDNPRLGALRKLFDIEMIPRNLLLDENRRIVAVNLRGEELEKKMTELTR
jgi:hypothetical protein